jgi:ParB-like chromosome segregation protein Spo0J
MSEIDDLEIERLPIEALLPYARNMNKHTEEHVAEIAASIKEFGWTYPPLIDKENVLVAGHGRVLAARKLGLAIVPCIRRDHWTEAQVKAYRILDNRLPNNAVVRTDMLSLELQDLAAESFDLGLLGFDEKELAKLLNPDEEAPPEPAVEEKREFLIVIEAADEAQQQELFEELQIREIKCKLM